MILFNSKLNEYDRLTFHDIENPSRYVEAFTSESWNEHLRQHKRITKADIALEELASSFYIGKDPSVSYFIGENVGQL